MQAMLVKAEAGLAEASMHTLSTAMDLIRPRLSSCKEGTFWLLVCMDKFKQMNHRVCLVAYTHGVVACGHPCTAVVSLPQHIRILSNVKQYHIVSEYNQK